MEVLRNVSTFHPLVCRHRLTSSVTAPSLSNSANSLPSSFFVCECAPKAADVVKALLDQGEDAASACKGLMELANRRWSEMVGDYRDDITATVVRLPFLPPGASAAAAAAASAAATAAGTAAVADVTLRRSSGQKLSTAANIPTDGARSSDSISIHDEPRTAGGAAAITPGVVKDTDEASSLSSTASLMQAVEGTSDGIQEGSPADVAVAASESGSAGALRSPIESELELLKEDRQMNGIDALNGMLTVSPPRAPPAASVAENTSADGASGVGHASGREGSENEPMHEDREGDTSHASDLTVTPAITPESCNELEAVNERAARLLTVVSEAFEGGGGTCASPGTGDEDIVVGLMAEGGANNREIEGCPNLSSAVDGRDGQGDEVTCRVENNGKVEEEVELQREGEMRGAGSAIEKIAVNTIVVVDDGGEGGDADEDDWDFDFGAREKREPSREMREASREFLTPSRGGNPLETLVVAGADNSRLA